MADGGGGGGHRNFVITSDDQGGVVVIVVSLLATWTILSLLIRVYTRLTTKISLGIDDVLALTATVLGVVGTILTGISVSHGFGKADNLLSTHAISSIAKYQFSVTMLTLIAMTIAKCTMICLHLRITPQKNHRTVAWALMGLTCAVGIVWVGILAGRCNGQGKPWAVLDHKCSGYVPGWIAITALDVLVEVLIFLMPVWIIGGVQMSSSLKFIVIATFGLRLPIIAASITHLYVARQWYDQSGSMVRAVTPFVCLQVEMYFGIISTTFPTIGPFMKSLNTRWGTIDPQVASSYAMDSLNRETAQRSLAGHQNQTGYAYRVKSSTGGRKQSSGSNDSSRMIIHHTTETTVEYGAGRETPN